MQKTEVIVSAIISLYLKAIKQLKHWNFTSYVDLQFHVSGTREIAYEIFQMWKKKNWKLLQLEFSKTNFRSLIREVSEDKENFKNLPDNRLEYQIITTHSELAN